MKKTMMFLGVLSLGLAHAQQEFEGKVGVNTHEPTATLEIKASMEDGSRKEGLLIPRMSKANLAKIADPTVSTLIYVNEATTYTAGTDTNADDRVELIDAVGFYHYNGTQWVKHLDTNTNDDEWVYEPTNKRINLRRSGGAEMSNSSIFYNQHGAYINTNMLNETTSFFDYDTKTIKQANPIEYDRLANNLLLKKITPETYLPITNDGKYRFLTINSTSMYVEDTEADKDLLLRGANTSIETSPTNVKNYLQLVGDRAAASHSGTGDAKYIIGNYSDARLERGTSTGYVFGGRFTASYATNQSSNQQAGIYVFNQVLKTGEGSINKMTDITSYTSFANEGSLTVKEAKSLDLLRSFVHKAPLTITTAIGIDYQGIDVEKVNNLTLTNNYGLKIGNIKGASTANYAIHTGVGKVYLGDEVEVKGSIKVASSTKTDPCGDDNKGTIRFDATAKKFQGCTGTEWKDLHN